MEISKSLDLVHQMHSDAKSRGLFFQDAQDDALQGRRVQIRGRDVTSYASCSYLGLELDPRLIEGSKRCAEAYGTQFSSSRGYISAPPYAALEAALGELFGGHALAVPSTTLGHLIALPSLLTEQDAMILDHQVHYTVQMAARFAQTRGASVHVVRHDALERCYELVERLAPRVRTLWIAVDGVYSMFGDLAPVGMLQDWLEMADNVRLYVDDAHGMSWAGRHGRGSFLSRMPLSERVVVATSFAKGFGCGGGALVFADAAEAEFVRLTGGPMAFSGPMQPPMLGAALASAHIHLSPEIGALQATLRERVTLFNDLCEEAGIPLIVFNDSPIFFIRLGKHTTAHAVSERLLEEGHYVNVSMFPAVPQQRAGLRVALTALHAEADVRALVEAMARHIPAVLAAEGISPEVLNGLFEGAIPEESSGRLRQDTTSSRAFIKLISDRRLVLYQHPTRMEVDPASLEVETHDSIEAIDRSLWDRTVGPLGCCSWEAMRAVEAVYISATRPEEQGQVRYVIVRDPGSRAPIAISALSMALQKDDMLMRAEVSRHIEALRERDPLLYSSPCLTIGSYFSEGEHLWIDRDGPWRAACARLIDEARAFYHAHDCELLVVRDLPDGDDEMEALMHHLGLVKTPVLASHELEISWASLEDYAASMTRRRGRFIREQLAHAPRYEVSLHGHAAGVPLDDLACARLHELYLAVAARNHRINIYPFPPRLLRIIQTSPAWELLVLRRRDETGALGQNPVAWFAAHLCGGVYTPLFCGLDYRFSGPGTKDSAYRQLLLRMVERAIQTGARRLRLGMDASSEKQRLGARVIDQVAYVQARDVHNKLEDIVAELALGA